jgi:hypothetical protein
MKFIGVGVGSWGMAWDLAWALPPAGWRCAGLGIRVDFFNNRALQFRLGPMLISIGRIDVFQFHRWRSLRRGGKPMPKAEYDARWERSRLETEGEHVEPTSV